MDANAWHARFSQQAKWTAGLRQYLFDRAKLNKDDRILEIGCGTGAVLNSLIQKIDPSQVFGLDLNITYLSLATRYTPQARFIQADAQAIPFPDDSFDIVFCHFLLLWVENPLFTVREMARIARRGGWVLALAEPDYGGRIDFPEALAKIGQMQETMLRQQGAETRIGRRLAALFNAAALNNILTGVLGGEWSRAHDIEDLQQEWEVMKDDLRGQLTQEELSALIEMDYRAYRDGERILYVPTFYAMGQKP
jgi:ubiquinone/menaquinone biosynthesis C-methylase UbiE